MIVCCCVFVSYLFSLFICDYFFFFKQKTAYEMRISDWSSDVCSSDLFGIVRGIALALLPRQAMPLGDGAKAPLRNQQPAGKDIGLDEVGVARIAFKDRLVDRDELHRSLSAGPQHARERSQKVGPIFLPHRFHHFDTRDRIEPAVRSEETTE